MATKVKLIEPGAVTGNIIPDGGIATGKLADDAVTTIKISDANITHAKLHTSMDLTGKTVTVATAAGSTNTTAAASTAFVQQELTTLIGGAPSTLNDLNELAAAINDDANYNSTLTTALATKLPLAGGTMTGALDVGGTITGDDGLSIQGGTGNAYLQVGSDTGSWTWKNYRSTHKLALEDSDGTGEVLNFDTSGNATFAGTISSGTVTSTGIVKASTTFLATSGSMLFYVPNVGEAMQIQQNTGNVGIGANNPAYQVHIKKTGSAEIELEGTVSAELNLHDSGGSANTRRARLSMNGVDFKLSALNDADDAVTHEFIAMKTDTGNVGIGTTAPSSKLHIDSATTSTTLTIESIVSPSLMTSGIDLIRHGVAKGSRIESLRNASVGGVGLNFLTTADNAAEISGTLVSKMVILRSGNVGIGTSSPTDVLSVKAPSGSNGGIGVFHNNGNKVAELVHHGSGDEGRLSLFDGGTKTVQLHGETGQDSYINSGNVGIGLTSPIDTKLVIKEVPATIVGGNAIHGSTMKGIKLISTLNSDESNGIWFGTNGSHWAGISGQRKNASSTWGTNLSFYTHENAAADLTYTRERMTIDSAGNVGIGRTSISQPSAGATTLAIQGTDNNKAGAIRLYSANDSVAAYIYPDSVSGLSINTSTSHPMVFRTAATERMRIDSSGNVSFSAPAAGTNKEITINGHNSKAARIKFAEAGVDKWLIGNGAASENGNFEIYASSGKNFTIAPATGAVTTSGPLSADSNATLIDTTVTGGNFVAGCAADTFHQIENINFNGYLTDHKYAYMMIRLFWTSGVTAAGYNHRVTIIVPNFSSNAHTSYSGTGSFATSHTGYGTGDGRITPLITASHHTAVTAIDNFKIDVKFDNVTTTSYDPVYMHVKTNSPPASGSGAVKIHVWRY